MLKDLSNDVRLVDEADDPHFSLAPGTGKRVGHHPYWRLDFDIDGVSNRVRHALTVSGGGMSFAAYSSESGFTAPSSTTAIVWTITNAAAGNDLVLRQGDSRQGGAVALRRHVLGFVTLLVLGMARVASAQLLLAMPDHVDFSPPSFILGTGSSEVPITLTYTGAQRVKFNRIEIGGPHAADSMGAV